MLCDLCNTEFPDAKALCEHLGSEAHKMLWIGSTVLVFYAGTNYSCWCDKGNESTPNGIGRTGFTFLNADQMVEHLDGSIKGHQEFIRIEHTYFQ